MKIVELTLNEKPEAGIDVISLVGEPAIEQDFYAFNAQKYYFETYNDYPQGAKDAAAMGIKRNEALGNPCATQVGKVRAQQLVNGEKLSLDTIRRMRSFLIRQKDNYELARDRRDYDACGYISYLLWGGESALPWAEKKLRQAGEEFKEEYLILDSFAESKQTFSKVSLDFDGVLTTADGRILLQELIAKGYEVYVISARDNKSAILELVKPYGVNPANVYAVSSNLEKVNTIKQLGIEKHYDNNPKVVAELGQIGQQFAEIGPRGGVKESPKAPKSDTPNPTPKGEDTAKGDASTSRGAEVDKDYLFSDIEHLVFRQIFADAFNLEVGTIPDYVNAERKLVGPIGIPNKLIRRVDEETNEEYFVYFTEETIAKLAEKFMKDGNIHASNIEHNGIPVEGVYLTETWIIQDPEHDKSNLYNQQYPKGTWMGMYKIDNPEIWKKIQNKEVKGFSFEGWFGEILKSN